MATVTEETKRSAGRSAGYPFIPLGKAVERAGELRKAVGKSDTRMLSAMHHWGYGPKSSGGIQTVAALKHFGLLEDSGSGEDRRVKLTERALRILLDERPNSADRADLIKRCAITPKMHQEMWQRWDRELPVDEEIRHYLIFDRDFNENGARDLIAEYKATLGYAGLLDSDSLPPQDADIIEPHEPKEEASMEKKFTEMRRQPAHRFFGGGEGVSVAPAVVAEGTSSLVLYNDRIRITADVDLEGAKELMRKLQKRIDLLEEEKGPN
ncbi:MULTISPECIES: hypothetical protein [unclassified Mesorhizobium]|uniref:hypothetical protein n=1 Tax=unclassified Mesorhizobium TaxID=325217 RepID=UPI000F75B78A|nr:MULTISPECIES: hypothetical protein [unclassified Mesorhizobium]AZO66034.1 hypothetical protein EJ075_14255 [Mesorhizobium sp. M6A.T.Cr.TU.016.01.1.1]RWN24301.1 MAG: hypothetical protein EOR95_33590 [Mesorhizobium sp.]RWP46266.1 MAG: hypothetical protein EOR06_30610 [Mesorhizobium sp.]RWP50585.1 MAG: hypothetical protein EOR05_05065 [Mesorhizobium sp.]RWP70520.1 MAG: hypothetical protein EOR09_26880 [Mesorhizobium sp.]